MNDMLTMARAGLIEALGLIEVLKTADVRAAAEAEQVELVEAIEITRQRLSELVDAIDDAGADSAPNCGARNR